jgi:hypothetical protein
MNKIWFGAALCALVATPAAAQDNRRNFNECLRELGLTPDPSYTHKLLTEPGRTTSRWYLHSDAQQMALDNCVARKANAAPRPSPKGAARGSL